jgi:hypothetical protein
MGDALTFGFENVEVPSTFKTPYIKLNKDEGLIEFKGVSIPENTVQFYYHFNRWLSEYSAVPAEQTTVHIGLHYMNSSSTVVISRMMRLLDDMIGLKSKVTVKWYYEKGDEEMKEQGSYYQQIIKSPVEIIEVEKL